MEHEVPPGTHEPHPRASVPPYYDGQGGVPRFHKLSFPLYDGKEDPLGWLNRCESFFRGQLTREVDERWPASFHMTGTAQQWYVVLERDIGMPPWDQFSYSASSALGRRSLPITWQTSLDCRSHQPSTPTWKPSKRAWLTLDGFSFPSRYNSSQASYRTADHIHVDVELHEPQDLHRAMRLARAYECRNPGPSAGLVLPPPPGRGRRTPALPVATWIGKTVATAPTRQFKYLTPLEMAERCKQGLCYNCDEPYVQGHKCAHLIYLEAADYTVEEPPEDEEEAAPSEASDEGTKPTISLVAFAGIRMEDTMQVYVQLGGQQFVTLLDSGSTHNFVRSDVARRIGLRSSPCPGMGVIVTNGDRVECSGFARDVGVRIADETFNFDCYTIPLDKWDVILGVTFLRWLGAVLWDFDDLCMAFNRVAVVCSGGALALQGTTFNLHGYRPSARRSPPCWTSCSAPSQMCSRNQPACR